MGIGFCQLLKCADGLPAQQKAGQVNKTNHVMRDRRSYRDSTSLNMPLPLSCDGPCVRLLANAQKRGASPGCFGSYRAAGGQALAFCLPKAPSLLLPLRLFTNLAGPSP